MGQRKSYFNTTLTRQEAYNERQSGHDSQHQTQQQPLRGNVQPAQEGQQAPTPTSQEPVHPKLRGEPQILGVVGDPGMNRDSGGSARFGDRVLWTFRDTNFCYPDGSIAEFPMMSSTASWCDLGPNGQCQVGQCQGEPTKTNVMKMYGRNPGEQSFYRQLPHICEAPAGNRKDGSRVALWPDQPPLVTSTSGHGKVVGYTWVKQAAMNMAMTPLIKHPAVILYKCEYDPGQARKDRDALPEVSIVKEEFWKAGEIPYGHYGSLLHDGVAYLYAQVGEHGPIALARCPASSVEHRSKYEYWVNGGWTKDMPKLDQEGIEVPNASAKGQGTYFWNKHWNCFVWIGGPIFPGADVHICTAPRPEGPWTEPQCIWKGKCSLTVLRSSR